MVLIMLSRGLVAYFSVVPMDHQPLETVFGAEGLPARLVMFINQVLKGGGEVYLDQSWMSS